MNELSIPKVKDSLPATKFDARQYRTDIEQMTDDQLDVEVQRTITEGVRGLSGFALAYHQNGIARHEQGKRTDNKQGERSDLLVGANKLSPNERAIRSENMVVAQHLNDTEVEEILSEGKGFNALVKQARINKRDSTIADPTATIETTPNDIDEDGIILLHGDFRERLLDLPDGSVDLIITDPPYPEEFMHLWSDLSEHAARLLGPRGIMFAMSGQIYLPEVMERLGEHLNYGWTFDYRMAQGSQSRILGRHIIQTWKPILAYTTGKWPSGEWGQDSLHSTGREKGRYEWQQSEGSLTGLIDRYSAPNGLVVDPFLGVGTYGVDAKKAGRRFIGVELNAERFDQAKDRITSAIAGA